MEVLDRVRINKLNKSTYDAKVQDHTITPSMIREQVWLFTDDQFVSADDKANWDNKADKSEIPSKTSELLNDSGFITGYTETDPTVPAWAKQPNKPTYTKAEVGLDNVENKSSSTIRSEITSANVTDALGYTPINPASKGVANGVAELDSTGKVPSSQLPSYVDDVLEYNSKSAFPATGESGKIYVAKDTNLTYRWSGSSYVEISPSLALGETETTAYRGDKGKIAYEHSQSPHAPVNAQENVIEEISVNDDPLTPVDKGVNISVPTAVSQLINDANYVDEITLTESLAGKQDIIQYNSMPQAEVELVGQIVQFTGVTSSVYTNGYFYKCVATGAESTLSYEWQQINVQDIPAETDPIFSASPAATITQSDIDNWNTPSGSKGSAYEITLNFTNKSVPAINVSSTDNFGTAQISDFFTTEIKNYLSTEITKAYDEGYDAFSVSMYLGDAGYYNIHQDYDILSKSTNTPLKRQVSVFYLASTPSMGSASYRAPASNFSMILLHIIGSWTDNTFTVSDVYLSYIKFNGQFAGTKYVLNNFLSRSNTSSYTPTADYHPATKKYVDDNIPTKTSDLTNDSGFITGYTETDPVFTASPAATITQTDINNWNASSGGAQIFVWDGDPSSSTAHTVIQGYIDTALKNKQPAVLMLRAESITNGMAIQGFPAYMPLSLITSTASTDAQGKFYGLHFADSERVYIVMVNFYMDSNLNVGQIYTPHVVEVNLSDYVSKTGLYDSFSVPAFNTSSTYAVGDYVYYGTTVYKCIAAVTVAGSWTGSSNWTSRTLLQYVMDQIPRYSGGVV